MTAYTVSMDQLAPLFAAWAKEYNLYIPTQDPNGFYDFTPWSEGAEIAWDYDLAYNNLKRFIMPPREDLIEFEMDSFEATPIFDAPKQLLFGVHPYDVRAINQLDQLLESGAPDRNYVKRRENTVVFAMTPQHVAETAFWTSLGKSYVDIGFDLYWTKIGHTSFYVEVGSPKGEELLCLNGTPPTATLMEREAAKREMVRIRAVCNNKNKLDYPWEDTPKLLSRNWNSQIWRHKSRQCLSCGSCVLVCPTCWCFEVREELDVDLKKGRRFREWDGCMLPAFALVAGDHNFRGQAMERYRHRYFRKGKYIFDKIGELGCVGCGRCVRACTASIANPRAVFNELWEAEQHGS